MYSVQIESKGMSDGTQACARLFLQVARVHDSIKLQQSFYKWRTKMRIHSCIYKFKQKLHFHIAATAELEKKS